MAKPMTEGNPAKLILFFTVPLILGNLFQQLYNMADTFIVGRTIGVKALAAVGSTGSLLFFIIGFAFGFTAGLSIITAQCYGAKDYEGVRTSFAASILLSIIVTIVLTIPSTLFARPVLELLNTPADIVDHAYNYLVIIMSCIFAPMFFNLFSNIIRALGDSKTPLFFLAIVCVLNIILDLVFILIFKMGVQGAAIATVISQLTAAFLCYIYIRKKLYVLHLTQEHFINAPKMFLRHIRIAIPMGFQASIIAIGAIILQFALNGLGTISIAAYTAGSKIDSVAVMPLNSFGATMATYTAQNYGAGKLKRIKEGVKQCVIMALIFSFIIALINITLGRHIAQVFLGRDATQAVSYARLFLIINGSMYWALALLFIYRFTLQGLGHSFIPTIAGIMELIMRAFAAIVLTSLLGFMGASMANPLAWIGALIPLTWTYHKEMKKLDLEINIQEATS
jgi:putative MATE family efflux protein